MPCEHQPAWKYESLIKDVSYCEYSKTSYWPMTVNSHSKPSSKEGKERTELLSGAVLNI